MNEVRAAKPRTFSSVARFEILVGLLFLFSGVAMGQGNTVSGHVFGVDRRPLADVHIELLDDLSRTISRSRTNASGRYFFFRLPAGRYSVKVLPFGTDYEEQEQTVEFISFRRGTGGLDDRLSGISNEQKDFYLRPRKGATPGVTGSVFAQEVPSDARKLYEGAVEHLSRKKTAEAYSSLKAALEIFPKYFAALELLGLEYVNAGHYDAASVLLTIAVDVNPRAYRSWHGLAIALNSLKNYKEAQTAVEKSIEINPSVPESLLLSGALLRQAKSYAEAEKRLTKAKELSAGAIPAVHWELALLYAHGLKRYKDAAKELKSYLKARPDDKNAENIKKLIADFEEKANAS